MNAAAWLLLAVVCGPYAAFWMWHTVRALTDKTTNTNALTSAYSQGAADSKHAFVRAHNRKMRKAGVKRG